MANEFPPLIPGDAAEVARRVAAVLHDAWQRLADQQAAVLATLADSGRTGPIVARLAEFQAAITDFAQRVDSEARAFVTRQLPLLYEQGALHADSAVGGRFTWTAAMVVEFLSAQH